MRFERLNEKELKQRIEFLHRAPSRKFEIVAIYPVQFETVVPDRIYQANYYELIYIFVER